MSENTDRLGRLSELGVSIWLDDLSRENLRDGGKEVTIGEHANGSNEHVGVPCSDIRRARQCSNYVV